jgi:hypothetical protein
MSTEFDETLAGEELTRTLKDIKTRNPATAAPRLLSSLGSAVEIDTS